jgi:hypothetical protein
MTQLVYCKYMMYKNNMASTNQGVVGSNPAGRAKFKDLGAVG